jgi:hypothetical protein
MAVTAEVVVPGAETGRQASESSAQPPSILGERVPRSPAGRPPFSDTPASADRAVPAEGPRETPAYSCEARPSPLDPRAAVGQDTRRRCEGSARREDADQHRADDIWPWRDPRQPIWSPVLRLPGASRQSVELPSRLPVCQGAPRSSGSRPFRESGQSGGLRGGQAIPRREHSRLPDRRP